MNREIPGYYFDKEKNRYFKIQPGSAAPADAVYNAENVKRRKLEEKEASASHKRKEKMKHQIKRASIFGDPLSGGRLLREFGALDLEVPIKTWTDGLRDKGEMTLALHRNDASIPSIIVNGDDQWSGMGVVLATNPAQNRVFGAYIPTDDDDRINFSDNPKRHRSREHGLHLEPVILHQISSLAYHKSTNHVLMTGIEPLAAGAARGPRASITIFSPLLSEDLDPTDQACGYSNEPNSKPYWLLGEVNGYSSWSFRTDGLELRASRVAPITHGSSSFSALLATSKGVLKLHDGFLGPPYWVTPNPDRNSLPNLATPGFKPSPADVLSVEWHLTNPDVCYAGARDGKFYRIDMRCRRWESDQGWKWYQHRSSAAHIRALDDNQVIVAGPRHAMSVYDMRYMEGVGLRGKNARPVVRMMEYQNKSHIHIGLDVLPSVGGGAGGGVVASGLDDGTVGLFSLRTGKKLPSGALADLNVPDGGVVKSLQWEKMPWERDTSLWVGAGAMLKKFTYGVSKSEEEEF